MRQRSGLIVAFTVAAIITLTAGLVGAADQDQVTLQKQDKLMTQIQQDTGMSAGEAEALRAQLSNAFMASDTVKPLRAMVQFAYRESCQGQCLGEALGLMQRAMNQNLTPGEASRMLRAEIRNVVRLGMPESETADMLRERVEQRIQLRLDEPSMTGTMGGKASASTDSKSGGGSKSSGGGGKK